MLSDHQRVSDYLRMRRLEKRIAVLMIAALIAGAAITLWC